MCPVVRRRVWTFLAMALLGGAVGPCRVDVQAAVTAYSRTLGGGALDRAAGIAVYDTGALYIAGSTDPTDFPVTPGALQSQRSDEGGFVAKFDPLGSLGWATYIDAAVVDIGVDAAFDAARSLYAVSNPADGDVTVTKYALVTLAVTLGSNATPPVHPGTSVTWTAAANVTGDLEYSFYRFRESAGWSKVQDWSAAPTHTWTPGPADVGRHDLQVWVRVRGSSAVYDAWAGDTITIDPPPPPAITALTPSLRLPLVAGQTVTWTAAAAGGVAPLQYKFVRFHAGTWRVVQDYSAANSHTWETLASDTGEHYLQVWVRSAGSTALYDAYLVTIFEVKPQQPLRVVLRSSTARPTPTTPIGKPILFTAQTVGGLGPYEYRFLRANGNGFVWQEVQPYSPKDFYMWTPTTADQGSQVVQVWVRRAGAPPDVVSYEAFATVSVFVEANTWTPPPVTGGAVRVTSLSADMPSPLRPGNAPVTWAALAEGGSAPLDYKFVRLDADGWHVAQDYSPLNTYEYWPMLADTGAHQLQVWVRTRTSSAALEAWAGMPFDVGEPAPIEPVLVASRTSPVSVGDSTFFTVSTRGGVGPLQYQFVRLDPVAGWVIEKPYSFDSFFWFDASRPGTHIIQVWVRNFGSLADFDAWATSGPFEVR